MKRHVIYLVCDKASGDAWPEWFYRREQARNFCRKLRAENRHFTGVVVKYAPCVAKATGEK